MQKIRRRKIGEILISEGVINQNQLTAALEQQQGSGESIGEILLQQSVITENDIVKAICIQYQLPFVRPSNYELTPTLIDRFEVGFLYRNRILPLDKIGECFIVALGDIPSESVEHQLRNELGDNVYFYFAPSSEVEATLRSHFSLSQDQVVALNNERAKSFRRGNDTAAPIPAAHDNLLETLDNSWEAIFDEAQQNVGQ